MHLASLAVAALRCCRHFRHACATSCTEGFGPQEALNALARLATVRSWFSYFISQVALWLTT